LRAWQLGRTLRSTAILTVVTVVGNAMYVLEDNVHSGFTSIPRSIHWAIVTVDRMTTVGYGDIAPQTIAGQSVALMMMVCGYSLLAVATGLAAAESMAYGGLARGRRRASKRGAAVVPTRPCETWATGRTRTRIHVRVVVVLLRVRRAADV